MTEIKDRFKNYPYKKDEIPVIFLHLEAWGKTIAFYQPLVNDLNYSVNELADGAKRESGDSSPPGRVTLMIGISSVHPGDIYSRSVGRQVSMGKMKPVFAWVKKAVIDKSGVLYQLEVPEIKMELTAIAKHGEKEANILNGYGLD
jgi:hypothetical protein